jgi:predicted phage terminase large subunit-like protein
MGALCDHVQALLLHQLGTFQNLLANVPPGSAKSTIVSVCTTPWMWLREPGWRGIYASGSEVVTMRDSLKCRDILNSDWYRETFKPTWTFAEDQNSKGYYVNSAKGFRRATTAGAKVTGERGDALFVDDPNDAQQAFSDAHLKSIANWWDNAFANRLNDMARGTRCLIQQRLNEQDLSGHVMQSEPDHWAKLIIRQEYERPIPGDPDVEPTPLAWTDPRTEPGTLMFPARFPRAVIAGEVRRLGSYGFAGQHQQRVAPAAGGILKRHWWKYWRPAHLELPPVSVRMPDGGVQMIEAIPLPERMDETIQSWDLAFKGLADSDYVVGQVWGALKADRFLLDQRRERLDMPGTVAAIRSMTAKHPQARTKLVEDKANGPAVIQTLAHEIQGLIAVNPEGGKMSRAQAVAPQIESGNVYLPHPALHSWVGHFIEECAGFPGAAFDDVVDAASQALHRLTVEKARYFRQEDLDRCTLAVPAEPEPRPEPWRDRVLEWHQRLKGSGNE